MAENTNEVKERDPNYRRKAQWFGLAAIGLLCVTLILSVFTGGKRRTQQREPLPVDQAEQQVTGDSQKALQDRIEQERIRRQRRLEAQGSAREKDPQARMRSAEERANREHEGRSDQGQPLSIEEEFKQQEKRRALMARRSKFSLRQRSGIQPAAAASVLPHKAAEKNIDPLMEEQRRIEREIQRLEEIQNQGATGAPSLGFNRPQAQPVKNKDPDEKITVGRPASEAEPKPGQKLIPTGTVISAVLDQRLMSDYIGPFRAMVTHDVYDVTNSLIIIPKGSRVTGRSVRISNVNEPIQARMGLTVKWLVLPDGKRLSFERRVAALDQGGVPAIKDKVNYHFMAQFLGVMAYAVLSSETSREGSGYANDQTYEGELGQAVREQFAPLAAKYLNLVPTITLRIGTPMKIFLEDDVYAYPWASLSNRLYQANRAAY